MHTVSPATKMAEDIIAMNVARGAEWLDEINPEWFWQIDISKLDLSFSEQCICGQIFCEDALTTAVEDADSYVSTYDNGYEFAVAKFFDNNELEAIAHGFQAITNYSSTQIRYYREDEMNLGKILESPFYAFPPRQYEFMAVEWIRQIHRRIQGREQTSND
jgi:hypothetical protein